MAIVYLYTKKSNTDDFLKYGIRLSKNYNKELNINGYLKQCICGLLNPKDDLYKYNSEIYDCLKLDMNLDYCKVIDSSKTQEGALGPKSIDLSNYVYGTFKNPEVLITTSILPEKISLLNKDIDVPVLFETSQELFFSIENQKIISELSGEDLYKKLTNT